MSREEKIRRRRLEILRILHARPDGRCAYTELAGKLGVSKRTLQLDGQKMCREELVRPCTGGLEITDHGRELCGGFSVPGDGGYLNSPLKKDDLRRAVELRLLYQAERSGSRSDGMTLEEMKRRLESMFEISGELAEGGRRGVSSDTLERDLQLMRENGLVSRDENRNWRLGHGLLPPLVLDADLAAVLMEQLQIAPGLVPMCKEMETVKEKLRAALVVANRERWLETLLRLAERVVVHGRTAPGACGGAVAGRKEGLFAGPAGETEGKTAAGREAPPGETTAKLFALLQEAASAGRAVKISYQGRCHRVVPRGIAYHWERGRWYLLAGRPGKRMERLHVFRVERIQEISPLDQYYPAPAFDLNSYLAGCWGINQGPRLPVAFSCVDTPHDPRAVERLCRELAGRKEVACTIQAAPDGRVEVRDEVEGLSEFLSWLRRYGDAVTVLSPAEVRESLCRTGLKMLQRYGEL
ncbi:helix-turn-helix transcriptional regulator [Desulfallas thermosapovorans]|uniref:Putative DNA-binding transcriptional regulator YafY n=1 Tax=Desulfallas thermosapovorans DSM 6562 TaxID=1121431 RepID=A0A5S4ZMN4_9FIRM|nr:WYL domain-containing protein [Desulfallas thermosapovorans]TYO92763.1 putative DNA-binding transcriptional regulator YafY [Desulfallas thermosapovorans DSM 6562]